jgi:hypothetical protein
MYPPAGIRRFGEFCGHTTVTGEEVIEMSICLEEWSWRYHPERSTSEPPLL